MEIIPEQKFSSLISEKDSGIRLDKYLTRRMQEHTRSFLGKLIKQKHVLVNGHGVKAGHKLKSGELISVTLPVPACTNLIPKKISFKIIYEDDSIMVISKPPGIVVHPGAGNENDTLVHGLLYHYQDLPGGDCDRPGIVHRLDKYTSGVMLVAKNEISLRVLSHDFKQRNLEKTYQAVLLRSPAEKHGRIVSPLGRHPVNRKKMAIRPLSGRYAATAWKITEGYGNGWCLAEISIETGRTHQIRVHMASLGCPVAGDVLYGGKVTNAFGLDVPRQLLHASSLRFTHPEKHISMFFTAPLWQDFQQTLEQLQIEKK